MAQAEKIIQTEYNISWLPQPNEGHIVLSSQLPPQELIVTAFVLAFAKDRFLQTRLVKRGWDLVGGHLEAGKSPAEAAHREAYEEASARLGSLTLLGYQHLHLLGPRPTSYAFAYPDSYQVFYLSNIISLDDFSATNETTERGLFSPAEAEQLPWVKAHRELYLAALAAIRKLD